MSELDNKVQRLVERLRVRQAEYENKLSLIKQRRRLTKGVFEIFSKEKIYIHTTKSIPDLLQVHAELSLVAESMVKSKESLGLGVEIPVLIQGHSYGDWENDIKLRVDQLKLELEAAELERLKPKVTGVLSESQRRAVEVEELEGLV